jgi:hypothetical protein
MSKNKGPLSFPPGGKVSKGPCAIPMSRRNQAHAAPIGGGPWSAWQNQQPPGTAAPGNLCHPAWRRKEESRQKTAIRLNFGGFAATDMNRYCMLLA